MTRSYFREKPSPRSGVSADRGSQLFPRIAALCRDAATPGFMVAMHAQNERGLSMIGRGPRLLPSPDQDLFGSKTRARMRTTNHAVSGIASSINITGMLARIG